MILLFGAPGAGKSVQAELLVKQHGWRWLSTGKMFRDSTDPQIHARMAAGELIDEETTNRVVGEAINSVGAGTEIVLDGYPRNLAQAQWLIDNLPTYGRRVDCIIELQVPEEELVRRLGSRGRVEDMGEVIKRRQQIYAQAAAQVHDFYRTRHVPVVVINGVGTVDSINEQIQTALKLNYADKSKVTV